MNETKTEHGKIWQTSTGFVHVTFFNNFERLHVTEGDIALELIDLGYKIKNKSITIVGGGVHKYNELLLDLETGEYVNEEIEWVEHGIWKLKYKLK
tara:strand:- start:9269 stop:9556 length:288 start_codon:yes stop_codon:yes gene_type:complete